jgi:cytoskeletal protein RodZ
MSERTDSIDGTSGDEEKIRCEACAHMVDPNARACPYCGADPRTGEKLRPAVPVDDLLSRKKEESALRRAMHAFRSNENLLLPLSVGVGVLLLIALSTWVTRQQSAATDVPSIPLSEITSVQRTDQEAPTELPEIPFQFDGNPSSMESLLLEEGAISPEQETDAEEQIAEEVAPPDPDPRRTAQPRRLTDTGVRP